MSVITTDETVRDLREALLACISHILELPPPATTFKQQHIVGRARAAVAKADEFLAVSLVRAAGEERAQLAGGR